MSVVGNIIWIVFGGFLVFLEYAVAGVALCLTVIGIPFGFQCFKLALLGLVPFGSEVVTAPCGMGVLAVIMNIIWIIFFSIPIVLTHVLLAVLFAITLIGIPFAVQHMKLARLAFTPFGLRARVGCC